MRRDAAEVPPLRCQGVSRPDHVLRHVRAELEAVPAMTERRSRIDHMAGPTYPSDDFEGCVVGGPDLASPGPNGPWRDGGSPTAALPQAFSPRLGEPHLDGWDCATCADRGTMRGRPCIDCSTDA